jgi:hypothetical protein
LLDLSSTNKALAAEWVDRDAHASLAIKLLTTLDTTEERKSGIKDRLVVQLCNILAILGDKVPEPAVVNQVSRPDYKPVRVLTLQLAQLYSMLRYDDLDVQRVVYRVCRESIIKQTADLVIEMETAIDAEDSSKTPLLPQTLLDLSGSSANADSVRRISRFDREAIDNRSCWPTCRYRLVHCYLGCWCSTTLKMP